MPCREQGAAQTPHAILGGCTAGIVHPPHPPGILDPKPRRTLYSLRRTVPSTNCWVVSIAACMARRSGENQKPLYTSSAYRGIMSSCRQYRGGTKSGIYGGNTYTEVHNRWAEVLEGEQARAQSWRGAKCAGGSC